MMLVINLSVRITIVNDTESELCFVSDVLSAGSWTTSPPATIPKASSKSFDVAASIENGSVSGTCLYKFPDEDGVVEINFSASTSQTLIASISEPIGYFGSTCVVESSPYRAACKISNDYSTWMSQMEETLSLIPINQVMIPGTHDSGTHAINENSKFSPDCEQTILDVYAVAKDLGLGKIVKQQVAKWAISHPHGIAQQLRLGIRYFDLRIWWDGSDLWIVHSLTSVKLTKVIADISSFATAHPKEVIFLDFNHFYPDNLENSGREAFVTALSSISSCLVDPTLGPTCTFSELWATNKNIVAFCADKKICGTMPNLWSETKIESTWTNTQTVSTLKNALDNVVKTPPAEKLWVLQSILTPDTGTIVEGFFTAPHSLKQMAAEVDDALPDWITNDWSQQLNIVIADWCEFMPYTSVIIEQNRARLINANNL